MPHAVRGAQALRAQLDRKDDYLAALKGLSASQAKEVEALSAHSRRAASQLRDEKKRVKRLQAPPPPPA